MAKVREKVVGAKAMAINIDLQAKASARASTKSMLSGTTRGDQTIKASMNITMKIIITGKRAITMADWDTWH